MKKIIISGYGGGIANSPYAPLNEQSFQSARNLDVYSQQRVLRPRTKITTQVFSPAISSSKIEFFHQASNGVIYWFGNSATSSQLRVWSGGIPGTPGTITLTTVGTSTTVGVAPDQFNDDANTLQGFHHVAELAGYLLFWTADKLSRIKLSDNTYTEDPYTFSATANTGHAIFTHEGQRRTFIGVDNVVYTLDSTSVSGSADPLTALTIDPRYVVKSFAPYGRFVLIGCIDKKDAGTSKVFVYDGTATTVDDMIDLGDSGLQSIRSVNGIIHVIACNVTAGIPSGYLRVYLLSGGSFVLGDEIIITPGTEASNPGQKMLNIIDDACVDVWGDRIYWGFRGSTNGTSDNYLDITNGIYAYGKFETNQPRIINLDLTTTSTAVAHSFTCVKVIKGSIFAAFNNRTTWYLEHQLANTTYGTKSADGVYESNVFPLNGGDKGKIQKITIQHEPLPASCGFTVQVKHLGHYMFGSTVPTPEAYQTLYGPQGNTSTSGMTQSTTGATYTEIQSDKYIDATHAEIKILFDEVSTVSAPAIVFPIIIEVE